MRSYWSEELALYGYMRGIGLNLCVESGSQSFYEFRSKDFSVQADRASAIAISQFFGSFRSSGRKSQSDLQFSLRKNLVDVRGGGSIFD